MLLYGGVVGVLLLFFWIWAIFDVISTDGALCRNLPKFVWLLLVIFLSSIGALAWLLLGRLERAGFRPGDTTYRSAGRPLAIEDRPDWADAPSTSSATRSHSEELDRRLDEWETEQRRREQNLRDRELRLREAELAQREEELRRRGADGEDPGDR
jgi:hypothetical protein